MFGDNPFLTRLDPELVCVFHVLPYISYQHETYQVKREHWFTQRLRVVQKHTRYVTIHFFINKALEYIYAL